MSRTIVVLLSVLFTISLVGCGDKKKEEELKKLEELKRVEEIKKVEVLRAKRKAAKELKIKQLAEEKAKAAKLEADKKAAAEREAKRIADEKAQKLAAELLKRKKEEHEKRVQEEKKNKLLVDIIPCILKGKFAKAVDLIERNNLTEIFSSELDVLKEADSVTEGYKDYFKRNIGKKIKLTIKNRSYSVKVKKVKRSSLTYTIKAGGVTMGRSIKFKDISTKDKKKIIDSIEDNDDGKYLFYAVDAVKKRKWDKALESFDNINLFQEQLAEAINALKDKQGSSTKKVTSRTKKAGAFKVKICLDSAHLILDPTVRKLRKRRAMYWSDKQETLRWWIKIKNRTGMDLTDYTYTFVLISANLQDKKKFSIMLKKSFKFSLENKREFTSEQRSTSHRYNKSAWLTSGYRYYSCMAYVTDPKGNIISTKVAAAKFKKIQPFIAKLEEYDCFTAKGQKLKKRNRTTWDPNDND